MIMPSRMPLADLITNPMPKPKFISEVSRIEGESRFIVTSASRANNAHIVSLHRTDKPDYVLERCNCEAFEIGLPRLIKLGNLGDNPEDRRCRHIRLVNKFILHEAQKALVSQDPSQPEGCPLPEQGLAPATRSTS